jgi:hypothetical protein
MNEIDNEEEQGQRADRSARRIDPERGSIQMNQNIPSRTSTNHEPCPTLLSRHEGGYAAQGPGFYVWDRDPSEVIRIAEALLSGHAVGSRTARFMVIGKQDALNA